MDSFNINKLKFVKQFEQKPLHGYLSHYIFKDENNNKYIVTVAKTPRQKRYVETSCKMQKYIEEVYKDIINFIPLIDCGEVKGDIAEYINGLYYAIYPYIENTKRINKIDEYFINNIIAVYNKAEVVKTEKDNIDKILDNFIGYHFYNPDEKIYSIDEVKKKLTELIKKYDEIKVITEHGDLSWANLLIDKNNKKYLIDFEQIINFQPVGFDLYFYLKSFNKEEEYKDSIPYYEINEYKYKIITSGKPVDDKLKIDINGDDIYVFDGQTNDSFNFTIKKNKGRKIIDIEGKNQAGMQHKAGN